MRISGFILIILFLSSCSSSYKLTSSREYWQGKAIYECIKREEALCTDGNIVDKTNELNNCQQYLLANYVLSEGLKKGKGSIAGFYISFVENLVRNMQFYTSTFRGEYVHYLGVSYRSRRSARKDLKDWKRILCNEDIE